MSRADKCPNAGTIEQMTTKIRHLSAPVRVAQKLNKHPGRRWIRVSSWWMKFSNFRRISKRFSFFAKNFELLSSKTAPSRLNYRVWTWLEVGEISEKVIATRSENIPWKFHSSYTLRKEASLRRFHPAISTLQNTCSQRWSVVYNSCSCSTAIYFTTFFLDCSEFYFCFSYFCNFPDVSCFQRFSRGFARVFSIRPLLHILHPLMIISVVITPAPYAVRGIFLFLCVSRDSDIFYWKQHTFSVCKNN